MPVKESFNEGRPVCVPQRLSVVERLASNLLTGAFH
jgi:hypothetical protein